MAAVSISPAIKKTDLMSNRRIPLANIPDAANSPRGVVAAAKRSRFDVEGKDELEPDQQPPPKRQLVKSLQSKFRTPPQKQTLHNAENPVFGKRPTNPKPTAFERRLYAEKERQLRQKAERQDKSVTESLEDIRQWQKYYRRMFPHFVFYFEGMPDDVRGKLSRSVRQLGAVITKDSLSGLQLPALSANDAVCVEGRKILFS